MSKEEVEMIIRRVVNEFYYDADEMGEFIVALVNEISEDKT